MNSFWIAIIYNAVRALVGSGLFDRAALLIRELSDTDIPGEEKKESLLAYLAQERANLSGVIVDGLIFAVRLKHGR